eukprot:534467_1
MSHVEVIYGFIRNFEMIHDNMFIPFEIKSICCKFYKLLYPEYPDFFVVARFRPISDVEKREEKKQHLPNDGPVFHSSQHITIQRAPSDRLKQRPPFKTVLEHILKPSTTQSTMFNLIGREMINNILQGYNASIILYGQTGSGKSYTIFGPQLNQSDSNIGLIQRCCHYLFHQLESINMPHWQVQISCLQIYKQHMTDLLDTTDKKLHVHTNFATDKPFVKDLKWISVHNIQEFLTHLETARSNHRSQLQFNISMLIRSHLLIRINIEQTLSNGKIKVCTLTFGDLAGSEDIIQDIRKALGNNPDRNRLQEAISIGRSVAALPSMICQLSKNRKPSYRCSVLTHILKDTFGGNCKTSLIVSVSPHQL